jgi:hypothetical protein
MHTTLSAEEAEQLAHQRARAKMGWLLHALVFLLVNAAALLLGWSGRHGQGLPVWGWGMALLIHGAAVLLATPISRVHDHLLQRERARLQARLDPW